MSSGWEVATAVGTIAGALGSFAAAAAALWISRGAREDAQAAMASYRNAERRDHLTDVLLRLQDVLSSAAGMGRSRGLTWDLRVRVYGLLWALPVDVRASMPALTMAFLTERDSPEYEELRSRAQRANPDINLDGPGEYRIFASEVPEQIRVLGDV